MATTAADRVILCEMQRLLELSERCSQAAAMESERDLIDELVAKSKRAKDGANVLSVDSLLRCALRKGWRV